MPRRIELVNTLKKPLDAKIIYSKIAETLGFTPRKVIVDNYKWIVTVEVDTKPDRKLISNLEKILREEQ